MKEQIMSHKKKSLKGTKEKQIYVETTYLNKKKREKG
jgi:hypothetical protein